MPYSWDTDSDYESDSTSGYSFHDARKSYDDTSKKTDKKRSTKKTPLTRTAKSARSYDKVAVAKKNSTVYYTYKSPFLKTEGRYPIVIGIDTTGSMSEWPKVFFEKLPLLYKEAVKYFPECEISFQAINDFQADGHDVAFQPAPFGKGPQLDEFIGQLYPYGGGGGQSTESYEIFAAYNSFLEAPNSVIKPVAIILGDEAPFDKVPPQVCRHYGLSQNKISSKTVFKKLHEKCNVFLVRKPYYGFGKEDEPIIKIWRELALIPQERIMNIKEPRRVVDVILGILGILTEKSEIFEKELKERQNKKQVTEVTRSLHSFKTSYHKDLSHKSVTGNKGKKSKGLTIDE